MLGPIYGLFTDSIVAALTFACAATATRATNTIAASAWVYTGAAQAGAAEPTQRGSNQFIPHSEDGCDSATLLPDANDKHGDSNGLENTTATSPFC